MPMKPEPLIIEPQNRAAPLDVLGTSVTVLASKGATGAHEITLQSGGQGLGPPPHSHDWDESFYVLRGSVEFTCAGQTVTCGAGTLVHVPAGTVHAFSYGPGGGEMLEIAGHGGMATRMFTALSEEIPPGPPDIARVKSVMNSNGVTVHL
jgi:quercetin dioxygenase-like cupin family protein